MPELTIHVPSYIGESYLDWDTLDWVQGLTLADVRMQLDYAALMGEPADSILLSISRCDGGSTMEGFAIYNYLRGLGLPIRTHILAFAGSMAVPLALAGDTVEMEHASELMVHRPRFSGGVHAELQEDLRSAAEQLDNTSALLQEIIVARSGQPAALVATWFTKDTWFTATQALAVGLCHTVRPLETAVNPAAAQAQATARRPRFAQAVARAERRPAPAALAAPAPAAPTATSPRPAPVASGLPPPPAMPKPATKAATPKATPRAAAKSPQNRKTLFQQLKELFNDADEEQAATETENMAPTESTELENGAFLYHEGALAVDTLVFEDEALTLVPADGDYDTADGQVVTVLAGAVTHLMADPTSATASPAATIAAVAPAPLTAAEARLTARLDALEARFKTEQATSAALKADNERLKAAKPALPKATARAGAKGQDAPDPKDAARAAKAGADHHKALFA